MGQESGWLKRAHTGDWRIRCRWKSSETSPGRPTWKPWSTARIRTQDGRRRCRRHPHGRRSRTGGLLRGAGPAGLGKAVITPGFNLPNRWVIHTVAVSFLNYPNPDLVLAQAIDAALKLANEHCIQSLAMPAIRHGRVPLSARARPTTPPRPWPARPPRDLAAAGPYLRHDRDHEGDLRASRGAGLWKHRCSVIGKPEQAVGPQERNASPIGKPSRCIASTQKAGIQQCNHAGIDARTLLLSCSCNWSSGQ